MGGLTSAVVGSHIIHLKEVTSTNDLALELAEKGAPEGWVVSADRQTQGRGKAGRVWESPPGGLWASIILRPSISTAQAPIFTLLGAVASAEAIRRVCQLEADVRWPNDLYLYGKKLGGVLCEMKANQRTIRYLVMGIGINVNQKGKDFSGSLRGSVTSLRLETGREWDREALAEALYDRVEFWYRSLQNQGRNALVSTLEGLHGGSEAEWRRLRETMRNV